MKYQYENKFELVNTVFNNVSDKYDLMNDIMSLGTHRIWKKNLISWMKPSPNHSIIDVASGTGDLAKLCSESTKNKSKITCVEPNKKMLATGKAKLKNIKNIKWVLSTAEVLPFENNSFDLYVISFGIRNVTDINKSLKEAFRVLKTGGRFFCLEFSHVQNELLKKIYDNYSKIIPSVGKFIVGNKMPYEYLIKSINEFYSQEDLARIISKNGFIDTEYRNLTNGIAAIHTGWKI
jgi:demethylmenaquinone methyltransferase/2-methoxy-6-polyprenyl-1,4-benzoquinol methylase